MNFLCCSFIAPDAVDVPPYIREAEGEFGSTEKMARIGFEISILCIELIQTDDICKFTTHEFSSYMKNNLKNRQSNNYMKLIKIF